MLGKLEVLYYKKSMLSKELMLWEEMDLVY